VATCVSDPVETGLMASITRPGGNLTCVSVFSVQLVAKRLQPAREIVGNSEVVAFLSNPNNPNSKIDIQELEEAAKRAVAVNCSASRIQRDRVRRGTRRKGRMEKRFHRHF
jgi:ABC-type uncharacterized transport system substrate-binding protein